MEIRPVRDTDAAEVTELLAGLGYPGNTVAGVHRRLVRWSGAADGAVFVAESAGAVAGVVAVAAIPLLERDGSLGRIVALVVDESRRGAGSAALWLPRPKRRHCAWGVTPWKSPVPGTGPKHVLSTGRWGTETCVIEKHGSCATWTADRRHDRMWAQDQRQNRIDRMACLLGR